MKEKQMNKTLKNYLDLSSEEMFELIYKKAKKNNQVATRVNNTLFNTFACLEPIINEFSFERMYQVKNPQSGKDSNRFVSFCPVAGKRRLNREFFIDKAGQVLANQNRTELKDIISDLVSWQTKYFNENIDENINLGLMPGWISSAKEKYLFCLDIDNKGFMVGNIDKVVSDLLKALNIPSTFIVNTPSGGKHLYFYSTKEESNSPFFQFIDVRAKTYWLAPGSTTEKGKYVLDLDNKNYSSSIATLPENWREIASCLLNGMFGNQGGSSGSSPSPSSLSIEDTPIIQLASKNVSSNINIKKDSNNETKISFRRIKEGERSSQLVSLAGSLVYSCSSESELCSKLLEIRNTRMENPDSFLMSEVENISKWILNKVGVNNIDSPPSPLPLSIELTPSMSFENKDTSTKVKFSKNDILKEGTRSNHLVSIAGGLVWSCSSQQDLENKLLEIRNTRMENKDSFSIKEVENIAKWIWSKHTETTPSPPSFSIALTNSSTGIETQGQYTKELISKLSSFRKEETHEVKIESISKIIQSYFEKKFGREYSKPILTKAVGQILRAAGFTKKLRRNGKDRTNFWNISVLSIVSLMTWVDSIHLVQTRNENMNRQSRRKNKQPTPITNTTQELIKSQPEPSKETDKQSDSSLIESVISQPEKSKMHPLLKQINGTPTKEQIARIFNLGNKILIKEFLDEYFNKASFQSVFFDCFKKEYTKYLSEKQLKAIPPWNLR